MLMFREEKSPEDEIKAWQFWHGRQHSVKQRILDAGRLSFFFSFLYSAHSWPLHAVKSTLAINVYYVLGMHGHLKTYSYLFTAFIKVN